jgi:hypothetical protein
MALRDVFTENSMCYDYARAFVNIAELYHWLVTFAG